MKIYCYWPHPHRAASAGLLSMMRPEDELTVHALGSLYGEVFDPIDDYEVIRTLPDPTAMNARGPLRYARPASLALGRSRARARVLRRNFDLVYLHMLFHHTDWAEVGRIRKRFSLVSHVHDVLPHQYRVPEPLERAMLRKLYRTAGHLVVYHDVLKQELVSEFSIDSDLVHVVPHPFAGDDLRNRDLPPPERPVLLFFGRYRVNKGLEMFVEAVEALGTSLEADVVIAGEVEPSLGAEIARRIGGMPHVSLELNRIPQERKHELMSRATWLVLPYTSFHSQSAMIGDALAYRLPLIVTDVGALGATVREDDSGIVVAPRDTGQLAEALVLASDLPTGPLQHRIEQAVDKYDPRTVYGRLREIFDEAVETRT